MTKKKLEPLSAAQNEIMQLLWEHGELSAPDVREALEPKRRVARTTVHTMLARMVDKGWIKSRAVRRSLLFSPTVPRSASLGQRVREFVDSVFEGSPEEMMSSLLEHRGLTREEAERIKKMIEQADRERKRRKGKA